MISVKYPFASPPFLLRTVVITAHSVDANAPHRERSAKIIKERDKERATECDSLMVQGQI